MLIEQLSEQCYPEFLRGEGGILFLRIHVGGTGIFPTWNKAFYDYWSSSELKGITTQEKQKKGPLKKWHIKQQYALEEKLQIT